MVFLVQDHSYNGLWTYVSYLKPSWQGPDCPSARPGFQSSQCKAHWGTCASDKGPKESWTAGGNPVYLGCSALQVAATTIIITCLVGNPYKPSGTPCKTPNPPGSRWFFATLIEQYSSIKSYSLGIQSPKLRMVMKPQNYAFRFGDWTSLAH